MAESARIVVAYGTRPEAIKLAPLVRALAASGRFEPIVAVSGQHREMLDQVNEFFEIRPQYDLDILQPRQTLTEVTTRSLSGYTRLVNELAPHAVVVQGDTTTTCSAALASFYHQVPVVHLEAGLRTMDRYSPFPEEINRRLTSQLASLHLAPTASSRQNLVDSGVPCADVTVTGNTVIDALMWAVDRANGYGDEQLAELDRDPRRVLLVTAHRRESWGEGMLSIGRALASIARREPDLLIVFPIHRNPLVRQAIVPHVESLPNVILVEPLSYPGFALLMKRATVILTDSGGVQEEGPSLGKPVLVMRDTTERPEAVVAGTVRLVGTQEDRILGEVQMLLHDDVTYREMANAINPYGDGRAAARSLAAIGHLLGMGERPADFEPA